MAAPPANSQDGWVTILRNRDSLGIGPIDQGTWVEQNMGLPDGYVFHLSRPLNSSQNAAS
jgi:hypothetical protein